MRVYPYWQDEPDAPYATFLSMVESYCHPEADDDAYDALKRRVKRTDVEDVRVFKRELSELIVNPSVLPKYALDTAAGHDDGSDERFLARLWKDLYPEEPYPGKE